MATKNNRKSSFANYQTSKSQYNNLNLNQNFPASNEYLSPFKSSNDKKKASVYDFAKSRQTQLWNKSTKETVLTATETCRDQRNCEIRELNISTYDLVGNGNAALTKPFVKTISGGTASAVKVNPFEFLRQQEDNVSLPETSQFKASQELLKPNPPMGGQCLSYASVPTWFPMVASYSIMFILLFIVFVAYAIDENRKKSYYGIVDEMEEEIKDQEEAEACGAHTDGEIRVIQTTDPATSSSITKVFMVKKPLKNSLPSPSSASPISALFKRDCIFEIVEDLIGIDAVELSDSLKYQVIAVCQQLCENDLLSPKAEIELANYIMDAMKCRLEKASKKDLICYGVMVETKQILMAKSDIELPDVIAANIFTIKFREPINLILYLHQVQQRDVPSISQ